MRFIALGSAAGNILHYYLAKYPNSDAECFHFTFDPMDLVPQSVELFDPSTAPVPQPKHDDPFRSVYYPHPDLALCRMRHNREITDLSSAPLLNNRDPLFLPTLTTCAEEPRLHRLLLGLPPHTETYDKRHIDYAAAYSSSACSRAAVSHLLAARTDPILFLTCFGDPDSVIFSFALRLACEQNIPNQTTGTTPFVFEGTRRMRAAEEQLVQMRAIRAEFGLPEALSLIRKEDLGKHLLSHHGRALTLPSAVNYCCDVTSDLLETLRQAEGG